MMRTNNSLRVAIVAAVTAGILILGSGCKEIPGFDDGSAASSGYTATSRGGAVTSAKDVQAEAPRHHLPMP